MASFMKRMSAQAYFKAPNEQLNSACGSACGAGDKEEEQYSYQVGW